MIGRLFSIKADLGESNLFCEELIVYIFVADLAVVRFLIFSIDVGYD